MTLAGADPRGLEPVVLEHGAEALRQRASAGVLELVCGRAQVVAAKHARHAAELPKCSLNASNECLERLAERERDPSPSAERRDQVKEQMRKRAARDGDTEGSAVGEVDGSLASGLVLLLERRPPWAVREERANPARAAATCALGRPRKSPRAAVAGARAASSPQARSRDPIEAAERPQSPKPAQTDPGASSNDAACSSRLAATRAATSLPNEHSCRPPRRPLPASDLPHLLPQQPNLRIPEHRASRAPAPVRGSRPGTSHAPSVRLRPAVLVVVDRKV